MAEEQSGRRGSGCADCQQIWCVGLEAKGANCILGCNEHSLTNWSKEMIFLLYLVLIQLHLEYRVNFSAPQFKKEFDGP